VSSDSPSPIVYVVDNDIAAGRSLQELLESVDIDAQLFPSGTAFFESKAWEASSVGCILIDVKMPGIDGLQLHQRLTEAHVQLPVILMTGYADDPVADAALSQGAIAFLEKPYRTSELLSQVNRAIELSRSERMPG